MSDLYLRSDADKIQSISLRSQADKIPLQEAILQDFESGKAIFESMEGYREASLSNFTAGQAIFESITASAEIIAELNDFISGQAIFESVSEYSNAIYYKSIKTKSDIITKISTKGEIA